MDETDGGKFIITIRKANLEDHVQINQLNKLIDPSCWSIQKEDVPDYYVATTTDEIIGMAQLVSEPSEPNEPPYDMIGCMSYKLSSFAVHPDYRRQGIGTQMVQVIYDDLQFYYGIARVEWLLGSDAYEFWAHATAGMAVKFEKICHSDETCDCHQCRDGLDMYFSVWTFDGASHLAVLLKPQPLVLRPGSVD